MQEILSLTGAIAIVTLTYSSSTQSVPAHHARDAVIHWCHCHRDADIFQQDTQCVPVHHAHQTTELLQRETTKLIGPDLWIPNSLDLNPANYHIWGVMRGRVYQTQIQEVAGLKTTLC